MTGSAIPMLIDLDPDRPATEQQGIHNRWHHEIPAFKTVKPNTIFRCGAVDWTGGQVKNNDDADDLKNINLTRVHNLTGPIDIEGAQAGDYLVVDILDVQPYPQQPWGFTGIFEKDNGGGLFANEFDSKAAKAIWDFEGIYATSRHIPGVRFAGIPHPGLIGTRPSPELLQKWNEREGALIHEHQNAVPPKALPPEPRGAYVGQSLPDDVRARIYNEGARTIPGREHGGNVDIKNLSRGSRVYLPVFTQGAGLSFGDLHFSQGDGEVSFCGAVEMAGIITLKVSIIPDGVRKMGDLTMPIFLPSPIDPKYGSQVRFSGVGVDHERNFQHDMDLTRAFKNVCLDAIKYLMNLGYTREQSYLLLSAAPIDANIGAVVDSPNACVSLGLPVDIFERSILPSADGFKVDDYGQAALRSDGVRGLK